MKTKTVWQCDSNGYLVGPTVADESPLESGTYLIPAGAVTVKPPHLLTSKQEWRWDGKVWQAVDARPPVPVLTPAQRLAEFLKANPDVNALISG
ncbi:hypothetical protein I5U15_12570 [Stenotrophomonas maltophilia]|nr:hypothetical protein [Stenotrophomonas maltophilia]